MAALRENVQSSYHGAGGEGRRIVTGIIKKIIHAKGFAFASTEEGDVFIPAKVFKEGLKEPHVGENVKLKVKLGDRGLVACMPPVATAMHWASWQIGKDQLRLPDTFPGMPHDGIDLQCWKCGALVIEGSEIWKIKGQCAWTKNVPDSITETEGSFNKYKNTYAHTARCAKCSFILGSVYAEPFKDRDEDDSNRPFPYAKLYGIREQKGTDVVTNSFVLAGSKDVVEAGISRLCTKGGFVAQARVTAASYEAIKHAKDMEAKVQALEQEKGDHVARELQILSLVDKQEEELAVKQHRAKRQADRAKANEDRLQSAFRLHAGHMEEQLQAMQDELGCARNDLLVHLKSNEELAVRVKALKDRDTRLKRDFLQAVRQRKEAEKTVVDIQEQAERAVAQAQRTTSAGILSTTERLWLQMAQGIETEDKVKAFFERRMPHRGRQLRLERVVKVANDETLRKYVKGATLHLNTNEASQAKGDTFLFHGSSEAAIPNIQAEGLSIQFANNGMLGKGLYGAPDPRKSQQYCKKPQNGIFMFVCRFNLSGNMKYAQNQTFDEFCVYDASHVVILWMLKCAA